MQKKQTNGKKDAFGMFPDLMDTILVDTQHVAEKKEIKTRAKIFKTKQHKLDKTRVAPPKPPDISWLRTGRCEDYNQAIDVPTALVLMADGKNKTVVSTTLKELDYHVEVVDTPLKAIEKIRSFNIAVIILHTNFEGGALSESTFHDYMKWLPMEKRRPVFYMLIGPKFRTLYNLEALSLSANLVVNDRHIKHLSLILRKSFYDYEELFGPFFETLTGYGKR